METEEFNEALYRLKAYMPGLTIREAYAPAMHITTQPKANQYYKALVAYMMKFSGKTKVECELIERSNIGYYTGYYPAEVATRVFKLFKTEHPLFGLTFPNPDQAFEIGRKWASSHYTD